MCVNIVFYGGNKIPQACGFNFIVGLRIVMYFFNLGKQIKSIFYRKI